MFEAYLSHLAENTPVLAMLVTLVCVLLVGTSCQIIAERMRLPATGPLLLAGLLFGPDLIGLIQPKFLGDVFSLIVKMSVAIVVFEGGLLLNVYDLRHTSRAVSGLVTVGLLITTVLGAVAAHFVLGISWEVSFLFGALISVTGPTVITPILQKVQVNRRVRSTLESESVIADAFGVILAAIIFTAITNKGDWTYVLSHGIQTVLAGAITGILVALYVWLISNRFHLLPSKYSRLAILGSALFAYTVAELFAPESGVLAAAIAGIAIGSLDIPHKEDVEEFKGDLASIAISAVFILLAASLRLDDLAEIGWRGVLIVVLVMILIRPVRVFVSTFGSELKRNEKLFISLIGPRGVVAASVATLFALELPHYGITEGKRMVALVFAVILGTVLIQGTAAGWFARIFRVMPQLTIIVGADETGRILAEKLIEAGEIVSMIDTDEENCRAARLIKGVNIYCDDASNPDVLKKAGMDLAKVVIVATPSDKVNLLICQVVRSGFGEKRIVARANTTSNFAAFTDAGIETMSPVHAIAAILENMVLRPSLFKLLAMRGENQDEKIAEVRVTSKKRMGTTLANLKLSGCLVVALRRDGKLIPPNGSTVIRYHDILTLLGDKESLDRAQNILQV